MLVFWLFLLFAAAVTAAVVLAGGGVPLAVLSFVLAFLLAVVIFLLVLRILTRKTDLSRPEEKPNPHAQAAAAVVGRILCVLGGVRPEIRGREKLPTEERFLFVCNHRSFFDPLMVMGYLPEYGIAFISKPSNMRIPLAGSIARTAGFLAIDRENDRAALRTILRRGICSIGIYPEGTRSRSGELLPFHRGSFKTAQRGKVPLVIASVRGTEKLKRGFCLHPHVCTLEILEVLPAERVKAASTQELAEYSRSLIRRCLEEKEERA